MVNLRKRQKASDDAPSQYAEQSSDESDSGSENEAPNQVASQKYVNKKAPAATTPNRRKTTQEPAATSMDAPLLELVKNHPKALTAAAKDWANAYQQDRAAATAELLTLLTQASGCSTEVTEDDVEEGEVDKLVKGLLQQVTQDGLEDQFKSKAGKSFKANYMEFWDKVMRECQSTDILFDNYLLEKVSFLVIALSCSVVRHFRYAATMTACQLVSSWIRTMQTLNEARETAQRQLDAESKKKTNKANSDRMASFQKVIERSHSQVTSLKASVNNIFQAVSAKRFRDVAPDIRALVIQGIAHWTTSLPADFLQDQYLKYVAWALSDREALVRDTAVTALLELYADEDNVEPMHELTARFAPRFAQLIHDVDEGVAVKGVQLLTVLVRLEEVPGHQVRDVYKLLLDDSYAVRHAAAELVADMLEESGQRHLAQVGKVGTGRGRKRKSGEQASTKDLQLAGILHIMFLLANDEEEDAGLGDRRRQSAAGLRGAEKPLTSVMVSHVVDALFDRVEILSDWKSLTAALLDDTAVEARSDASTTNLLLLLKDAAHKAVGGHLVPSRQESRKQSSKARQTAAASHKQELTLALTQSLPDLIHKYQTDAVKACALVGIIPDLNLDMYSLQRQEAGFQALLRAVADVLLKHVEADTVAHCARTLVHCTQHGPQAIQDLASVRLNETVEELADKLTASADAVLAMSDADLAEAIQAYSSMTKDGGIGLVASDEDEDLFACRAALLRLHHSQLLTKAPSEMPDVYIRLQKLLQAAAEGVPLGVPITELALLNTFTLLLWQLKALQQDDSSSSAGSQALIDPAEGLGERVSTFCVHLESIFEGSEGLQRLQDCIFRIQADLFLVFSYAKLHGGAAEAAGYKPSEESLQRFWEHCEDILSREAVEVPEASLDADTQAQRLAHAKLEQEAEASNQVKCEAVCAVGRLVAFQSVAAGDWLAPQLISHMVGHGKQVADLVKEVCRVLKKDDSAAMPDTYLTALQNAFQRHLSDDQSRQSLQDFITTCTRVAQMYAGFNASATALLHIAKRGVEYAFEAVPSKLPFLKGLSQVCSRLPARQADLLLTHMQQALTGQSPQEGDPEWEDYWEFLAIAQERASKGAQPRSALKDSAAKKAGKRRISFRPQNSDSNNEQDGGSQQEEEVEQAGADDAEDTMLSADNIEEDEAPEPAAPLSIGWKTRKQGHSRSPRSAKPPLGSTRRPSRFASQTTSSPIPSGLQDDADLREPDALPQSGASIQENGGEEDENVDIEGEEEEDVNIEGEDEEEVDIEGEEEGGVDSEGGDFGSMPTEEQLPGMQRSKPDRPRRSMKRLYEDSESQQQQSSAPVRDSQEDADLIVHPFGSTTQSDQPAQEEEGNEAGSDVNEEEQEPAPRPRRRRRI
ncbi:TPA: hypothetical protein ACH3X3_014371 [Trebouxia sp. C0006]